jgi:hypothetical protein
MISISKVEVGQRVRCERIRSARGSWVKYAGRETTVASVNKRDKEVGLDFGQHTVWFRLDELVYA